MTGFVFKKILLMGRSGISGVPETLMTLINYLLSLQASVALEENTAALIPGTALPIATANDFSQFQLIIVVGGDGSLLHAAHLALPYKLPVLGINRGRLGFLTDIHPKEIEKVKEVLQGEYREEKRFLLNAKIFTEDKLLAEDLALNDVVILPGDNPQMIEFETYVNNEFVYSQRADGSIVATPTGSTAYALSGGGPILHPQLNAVVIVPMFPHTLSSRPIVVEATSKIEMIISKHNEHPPHLSCDGQRRVIVPIGSRILIQKNAQELRLIHPKDYSYFKTLREKLGWEHHATRWVG